MEVTPKYPTLQATNHAGNRYPRSILLLISIISASGVSASVYSDVSFKSPAIGISVTPYMAPTWPHKSAPNHLFSRAVQPDPEFDWHTIKPSPTLNWVKCYPGNECARLEVPLDYNDPSGDQAAIALLRIPANVSSQSNEYRGPVLFNPGGPGESGVSFIKLLGERYRQILGDDYDIIGFDPRGIGETTPSVSAFLDDVERGYWNAATPPLPNSTNDALSQGFVSAMLFNQLVEIRSKRAAEFASTAVVARDMLTITKAHGRDRLQYWGVSYGSILGATYAAIYPNNIERLIIDGVPDFDDYYSGSWSKNLFQTDQVLGYLYDHCASAGPACPLHANSSALVKQRVESIIAKIKATPVAALNGTNVAALNETKYGIVNYRAVQTLLFTALYQPFATFPPIAQALADLENGNGWPLYEMWDPIQPRPKCDAPRMPEANQKEATLAVLCGEAEGARNTIPDIVEHFNEQRNISILADVWTDSFRTSCAGWKVRAKERYAGPFTVNTSFPLLVIGNTIDPVTPIVGAQKAAEGFGGSVLMTIDAPGHTSVGVTSSCANKIIRSYFVDGQLPPDGVVCDVENVLTFGDKPAVPQNMTA